MLKEATTLQEKRAVQFAVDLLTKLDYGYTVTTGYVELAKEFNEKGIKISFMSVMAYWKALERLGYVKREMGARINGVTHILNRYAFQKLIKQ